jgi:hypothetical protein
VRSRSPRLLRLPVMVLLAVPLALGLSLVSLPGPSQASAISAEDDPGAPAGDPAPAPEAETTPEVPVEPSVEDSAEPTPAESEVATDEASDEPTVEADEAVDEADEPVDEADESADEADEPVDEADEADAVDEADEADAVDEAAEETGEELVDELAVDEAPELEPQPEVETPAISAGSVVLIIRGSIGTPSGDVGIDVDGSGAAPGAQYSLWVFSQPQLLTSGAADAAGSFTASAQLPSSLTPGDHTVVLETTGSDGQALKSATGITIGADGTLQGVVEGVDASQLVVPKLSDNPKAPKYAPVAPLDNPAAVAATAVAALTVATVVGAAASAAAGGGGSGGSGGGGSGGGEAGEGLEAEVRRRKNTAVVIRRAGYGVRPSCRTVTQ